MKTEAVIFALCLCVGSAVAQQVKRAGLKETVFRSTADKPATTIHVTPADAAAFWKRLDPPDLADKPTELDEFRRVHAHKFWEPYVDQKITVSGAHYCYCCFKAAIGVSGFATGNSGRGYTKGWTIRLDDHIAIGFPEGSTAYTEDGEKVPLKGSFRPVLPIVQGVGTVTGPVIITEVEDPSADLALAYYVLEQ